MNNRIVVLRRIGKSIKSLIKRLFPKWQAGRRYRADFGRKMNWEHPTEFNEKLRWLQFNTDTSKWSLLADKYRVREYLENLGYGDMLVKLYGVWNNAARIDFSKLPDKFVLKTNHGSGGVYVVENKSTASLEEIRKKLGEALKKPFGVETAEPHYWPIKPVIIAEEVLEQDGDVSSSLIDYKFFCIYGQPQFCVTMYNRDVKNHTYEAKAYDINWDENSSLLGKYRHVQPGIKGVPQPYNFDKMKDFCLKVCAEFPFVRMDFYECNGKLYFGEFTFTPGACSGAPLSPEACEMLAKKIKLI